MNRQVRCSRQVLNDNKDMPVSGKTSKTIGRFTFLFAWRAHTRRNQIAMQEKMALGGLEGLFSEPTIRDRSEMGLIREIPLPTLVMGSVAPIYPVNSLWLARILSHLLPRGLAPFIDPTGRNLRPRFLKRFHTRMSTFSLKRRS